MATANLKAKISLDNSAFNAGIKKVEAALHGIQGTLGTVAGVVAGAFAVHKIIDFTEKLAHGVEAVLEVGASLSRLSARTGATSRELVVIGEVFRQAGMDAGGVGPALNKMQKALTGVNERGEPTNKTFAKLGLNMEALQKAGPVQAFQMIGKAINGLESPAQKAAAAMAIFGRSGGELLTVFNNSDAFTAAAQTLGGQADILGKNADAFREVAEKFGSIGIKFQGLDRKSVV